MMYTKTQIQLAKLNGTYDDMYGEEVNQLIRRKYSISKELSIMRQRDEKPEEFQEYFEYAEQCKTEAKLIFENAQ